MPLKPLKNDVLGTWLKSTLPHNPEVVGSSPASATKEPSKSKDLDGFSYAFRTLQMGLLTRFEHMCFGVANWL